MNSQGSQSLIVSLKQSKSVNAKQMTENEIANIVFEAALRIHKRLGPGLLESAYEECMFYELKKSNLKVEKQKALPLIYDEVRLDVGYRLDLLLK